MPERHAFKPLNKKTKEIRLLHLKRLTSGSDYGCTDMCIHGRLDRISLEYHQFDDDTEPYMALSYAWGEPHYTSAIVLDDGTTIPITHDLFIGLFYVFQDGFAPDMLPIWIDAVCINQSDDIEKSWQVAQMGEVYGFAKKTLIYLGPPYSDSDEAMDIFHLIGQRAIFHGLLAPNGRENFRGSIEQVAKRHMGKVAISVPWTPLEAFLHNLVVLDEKTIVRECLKPMMFSIMARPWWRRVWVLQELLLSCSRSSWRATFICGTRTIESKYLMATLLLFNEIRRTLKAFPLSKTTGLRYMELETCESHGYLTPPSVVLLTNDTKATHQFGFLDLLSITQFTRANLQTTDPRDYIYALLGIAKCQLPDDDALIYPDYSRSCSEAYVQAALLLLRLGCRQIFRVAVARRGKMLLPSWVPDWSAKLHSRDRPLWLQEDSTNKDWSYKKSAGGREILTISGHTYGRVQTLVPHNFSRIRSIMDETTTSKPTWPWMRSAIVLHLQDYCVNLGSLLTQNVTSHVGIESRYNMLALAMRLCVTPVKCEQEVYDLISKHTSGPKECADQERGHIESRIAVLAPMLRDGSLPEPSAVFAMPDGVFAELNEVFPNEQHSEPLAWAKLLRIRDLTDNSIIPQGLQKLCKELVDEWGIDLDKVDAMISALLHTYRVIRLFQPFVCGNTFVGAAANTIMDGDIIVRFDMDPKMVFVLRPVADGMFELIDKAVVPQLMLESTYVEGERMQFQLW